MNTPKAHIMYKAIILLLICSFIAPSIVKFTHVFENHKHEVCSTPQKSHFHAFDLDCEFYKFNFNPQISFANNSTDVIDPKISSNIIASQYQSISKFQRFSFSLRGPPALV